MIERKTVGTERDRKTHIQREKYRIGKDRERELKAKKLKERMTVGTYKE